HCRQVSIFSARFKEESMQATAHPSSNNAARWDPSLPLRPIKPILLEAAPTAPLHFRVLRSAWERQAIAGLRRHAAFGVEQDLGLGLQPFEQKRDEIGLVTAIYRGARVLATLRLVPALHGLTGAERLADKADFDRSILGAGSWEIGGGIIEPGARPPHVVV